MAPRTQLMTKLPATIVVIGMVGYAVIMTWFSIGRAANYNAGWYDLGIMAQTVWRVGHGHGFSFTNPEAGASGVHGLETVRTAIHTDYILMLLAPLSWFGETWKNMLVLQAVVLAAGAWFVFRIGRTLLGSPWRGALVAGAYLVYSPLLFANLFEFHAVTLAVTFFLAAADAIVHDRWRWMWLWVGLALITKEQVGLSLGLLAGFLWLWKRRPRRAWVVLGVCAAWTIIQFAVVIPLSRPNLPPTFVSGKFYGAEEGSFAVIKRLAHPSFVYTRLNSGVHRSDLVQLFAPFGGPLPLLSPLTYLMIPEMLLYWLSDSPNQQTLFLHYQVLFIPFILLGAILAWRWLAAIVAQRRPRLVQAVHSLCLLAVACGSMWGVWRASPWPWSPMSRWPVVAWKERQDSDVRTMLKLLPREASVAVTQNLGPQVSGRARVTLLPTGAMTEDYLVILQRSFDPNVKSNDKRYAERDMLEKLLAFVAAQPAAYAVRYQVGRVWLVERIGTPTEPEPTWPDKLLGR